MEDSSQINGAREHTEESLDLLLNRYRPVLWRYLRSRVRSEEDCEDILQETLLRVARSLPTTTLNVPLDHWVFRIATNCLRTFYRRHPSRHETSFTEIGLTERSVSFPHLQHETCETSLISRLANEQTAERLQQIIARVCSWEEQQVFLLYAQEESLEAVADMMRMNPSTVRSHLLRGRAKVLAYIVQHEPELVGGQSAIEQAIERYQQTARPHDRLSEAELKVVSL